jgi:hypothetical protein
MNSIGPARFNISRSGRCELHVYMGRNVRARRMGSLVKTKLEPATRCATEQVAAVRWACWIGDIRSLTTAMRSSRFVLWDRL